MKKMLCALALAGLFTGSAAADSNFGVKMGQLSFDGDSSAATQVGLVYTWDIVGMFGIEGELNTSMSDGEVDIPPFGTFDYSVTQLGAYGVLMTPGAVYFKGKAGFAYSDAEVAGVSDTSSDPAYGVGVGFELLGFVWEVEYTMGEFDGTDADFVSVSFKF